MQSVLLMRAAQENSVSRSSPVGSLMVAWMIVGGLAIVPVALWSKQHGDVVVLIAFCGAMLLIGIALFVATGLSRMGARSKEHQEGRIANVNKRGAVFGKR